MRETVTRAGGGFAFGGLGPGRYAVRALTGDAASALVRAIEARDGSVDGPDTPLVRLELSPGRTVNGRVADDTGLALADVPVRFESDADAPGEDPPPNMVTSDSLGPSPRSSSPAAIGSRRHARATCCGGRPPSTRASAASRSRWCSSSCAARACGGRCWKRAGAQRRARAPLPGERDRGSDRADRTAAARRRGGGAAFGRRPRARHDPRDRRRSRGRFVIDDLIPGRYRVEVALGGAEPLRSDES